MNFLFFVSLLSFLASSASFRMSPKSSCYLKKTDITMAKSMNGAVAILSALSIFSATPMPSYAGFVTAPFEVINPKDAVLNTELSSSDAVKEGLAKIKDYTQSLTALKKDLASDRQFDVRGSISKLDPGVMRNALNKYNTAFSEDTQRGTDRLIRNIIQDMTELQKLSVVKEGKARSETKEKVISKRIDTAIASLQELSSFLPQ